MAEPIIESLQKRFKFRVEKDPKVDFVLRFVFEDGRAYKFQEPPFLELHEAIYSGENAHTAALKLGMANTYVENEKTPKIDEEYLSKNKVEAFQLWTKLYGEVLFSDNGTRPPNQK